MSQAAAPLERALLGAMLVSPDVRNAARIAPEDFGVPARVEVCREIQRAHAAKEPIDPFLIAEALECRAVPGPREGWPAALTRLVDESESYWAGGTGNPYDDEATIRRYVQIIHGHAVQRRLRALRPTA